MNAIILAKGENSGRLSKDKSLIMLSDNTPVIKKNIEKISDIFSTISIVSVHPEKFVSYEGKKVKVIRDSFACGPLGAMYTGLNCSLSKYNFVMACDMPFINPDFISFMIERIEDEYDAVVPEHNGFAEVLHAFYSKNIILPLENLLQKRQYRVREVLERVRVKYIKDREIIKFGNPDVLFFNINTETDLQKAKDIYGKVKAGDFYDTC
ncbi:MAG: molybdenum cofactor guanylyltransferase [Candidatus Omnitrophica bacterium]|nr:molybdenum cofactor guanylyltransferase [Candidatus Omnitrophota bacterium]MCM8824897.1 molybdenum cofactor guanylyltransferase [Candidatus Omnitrophota bacterium]